MKRANFLKLMVIPCLAVMFFLIQPIFFSPRETIIPTKAVSLSELQNYYSIVYSVLTVIMGIAGLILGYFYFDNRKKVDHEDREREHTRKRLEAIIEEFNAYDKYVHRILGFSIRDPQELNELRIEIERTFEVVQDMLDQWQSLLKFDQGDVRAIIKVNSFVDQSEPIMRKEFAKLSLAELYPIKDEYLELVRVARRTCYLKFR